MKNSNIVNKLFYIACFLIIFEIIILISGFINSGFNYPTFNPFIQIGFCGENYDRLLLYAFVLSFIIWLVLFFLKIKFKSGNNTIKKIIFALLIIFYLLFGFILIYIIKPTNRTGCISYLKFEEKLVTGEITDVRCNCNSDRCDCYYKFSNSSRGVTRINKKKLKDIIDYYKLDNIVLN